MEDAKYPIGSAELGLYLGVWVSHAMAAFALTANASRKIGHWLDHWLEPSSYVSNLAIDNSDVELKLFRQSLPSLVAFFVLHSVLFRLLRTLPIGHRTRSVLLICTWTAIHFYMASPLCVLLILAFATAVLAICFFTKCQIFAWAIALLLIAKISDWAPFSRDPTKYFREFNLYLYTAIKMINLGIFVSRNGQHRIQIDLDLLLNFLEYLLYPPYSTALIVLFEDFRNQSKLANAHNQPKIDGPKANIFWLFLWRALRLLFWSFVLEFLLHLCRANAFFNSPFTMLQHFNNYEVASIAYVAGQLFHLKYLLIFGLPSLFASIDGFQPPGPPICIARVSKYSQMWRYFDRGLYDFLKTQVYIPLMNLFCRDYSSYGVDHTPARPANEKHLNCKNGATDRGLKTCPASDGRDNSRPATSRHPSPSPVLALLAPLGPLLSVFLFVLFWHGISSNYFWWVCLSAAELCIERLGRDLIWPSDLFQRHIRSRISRPNLVRLKAASMLFTVIPGIFGVFFFLSLPGIGSFIFRSVLLQGLLGILTLRLGVLSPGFVLLHLFLLGYCFNHICLYIEHRERRNMEKEKDH